MFFNLAKILSIKLEVVIAFRKQISKLSHSARSVLIWTFSGPFFSAFRLNADQKNSEFGHFSWSVNFGSKTIKMRKNVRPYSSG